jgi:hypothetical protein
VSAGSWLGGSRFGKASAEFRELVLGCWWESGLSCGVVSRELWVGWVRIPGGWVRASSSTEFLEGCTKSWRVSDGFGIGGNRFGEGECGVPGSGCWVVGRSQC